MSSLCWGVMLAIHSAVPIPESAVGEASAVPLRTAVSIAPLALAESVALAAYTNSSPMVCVPVGLNFVAGNLDWYVDAAFVYQSERDRRAIGVATPGVAGYWFSVGPVFHTGPLPLGGLYLSPRVSIGRFWWSTGETIDDVLLGLELGYQVVFERIYFSVSVGLSGGLGIGENDGFAGPFLAINPGGNLQNNPLRSSNPVATPILGLNLHFLRLGYAF